MHHDRGGGEVEPLRQGRRGDGHLKDIVAQQPFHLLAVGRRQGTVMQCDAQAKALEDRTVRPQPLLSECNGGVEHR